MKLNFKKMAGLVLGSVALVGATSYDCAKPFDQQFWMFQNMIRTNPADFVPILTEMKNTFSGNTYQSIDGTNI